MSDLPLHPKSVYALAYAARYGEPTDTYTWNYVADKVIEAAAPVIKANELQRVIDWLRQDLAKRPMWAGDADVVREVAEQMEADLKGAE